MSNINKIRIINLNYNNNTMKIDDEIFYLNGENSMLNLRNGGGKSVLVQMSIAPFVRKKYRDLGDRPFESYFTTRMPTYILVEWNLEDGAGFLLTGMMIRKKELLSDENSKDTLDIINYIHEYRNHNEFDIKMFPFIESDGVNKKIKSFQNAKKLFEDLKKNSEYNFNYYDMNNSATSRAYFSKLKEYGINNKEWESIIRKINLKESGLSELFKEAKNTEGLIKKWFLPSIEEKLSKDEDRIKNYKEIITRYITQYKANKSNIDRKLKIDLFNEKSKESSAIAKEFLDNIEIRDKNKNMIANTHEYVNKIIDIKEKECIDIENSIKSILEERKEVRYEEISMDIYKYLEKKDELIEELDNKNSERDIIDNKIKDKEKENGILKCADLYKRYTELSEELLSVETRLKLLKKEQTDNKPRINDLGYSIFKIYEKEQEQINNEIKALNEKISKLKKDNEILNKNVNSDRNTEIELNNRIGGLSSEIKAFDKIEQTFNNKYNLSLLRNLEGEYSNEEILELGSSIDDKLLSLEKKIKLLEKKLLDIAEKIKEKQSLKEVKTSDITRLTEQLKFEKRDFDDYSEEINNRKDILKYIELGENHVFDNAIIINKLDKVMNSLEKDKRAFIREYDSANKELNKLKTGEVLELSKELEAELNRIDINIIYGMKWLKNNGYSKEKNEEIVKANPFIPYSIIIEKDKIDLLKKEKIDAFTSNPVVIVEREKLENNLDYDKNLVQYNGVSFYLSFNNKLLDEEELKKLINDWENKIEDLEEKIKSKEDAIKIYNNKKTYIEQSRLTQKVYIDLQNKIENINKDIESSNKEIIQLTNLLGELNNEEKIGKNDIDKLKKDMDKENEAKRDYIELCKEYNLYKNNKSILSEEKEKLRVLKDEISKNTLQIESNNESIDNNKDTLYSYNIKLTKVNNDVEKYKIYEDGNIIIKDIEDLVAEYDVLVSKVQHSEKELIDKKAKLNSSHSDIHNQLINMATDNNIEEVEYRNVIYNNNRHREVVNQIKEYRDKLHFVERECNNIEKGIVKIETNIENIYKKLKEEVNESEPKDRNKIFLKDFKSELAKLSLNDKELNKKLKDKNKSISNYRVMQNSLKEYDYEIKELIEFDFDSVNLDEFINKLMRDNRINNENINKSERNLDKAVLKLSSDEMFSNDSLFKESMEGLTKVTDDPKKFLAQLDLILSSYNKIIDKLNEDMKLINKERDNIIHNLLEYVSLIHENINEIDDNSSIDINGKRIKMLSIEVPDWEENKELYELRVKSYIEILKDDCIKSLEENNSINDLIDKTVNINNLFDEIVRISSIKIKLYKIEENKQKQITWDEVSKNSGGEGFLSAFVILSSLLSYMRKDERDIFTRKEESKVLILDNPFAQTNAAHLLKPLIDIAKKSNTQLVCLTGLGGDSIYSRFDNIYVLNLVSSKLKNGLRIMKADHIVGEEEKEVIIATHTKVEDLQMKLF